MSDIGDGASITFGTTAFTGSFKTLQHTGVSRTPVDITHLGSTNAKEFMPGDLYDPGEISGTLSYNPDAQPPITNAAETITITFPVPTGSNNGATMACSGFVTQFDEPTLENDSEMIANITIKLTGQITWTDAS
jgi:hypothetical protein